LGPRLRHRSRRRPTHPHWRLRRDATGLPAEPDAVSPAPRGAVLRLPLRRLGVGLLVARGLGLQPLRHPAVLPRPQAAQEGAACPAARSGRRLPCVRPSSSRGAALPAIPPSRPDLTRSAAPRSLSLSSPPPRVRSAPASSQPSSAARSFTSPPWPLPTAQSSPP